MSLSPFKLLQTLGRRGLPFSENTILLLLAVAVGFATGVGVWLFDRGIEFFHHIFYEWLAVELLSRWLGAFAVIASLALAGLIVGWMMERFVGEERHHGLAGLIEAVALTGGRLRYRVMPVKSIAAALSLGAGASVGPEAPSVVIGANIGSFFGQRLHLSEERMRLLVAAGSASAIAAAFRAPIAGVFFSLEVILNGEFTAGSFSVVVLAAVIGSVFLQAVTDAAPVFGSLNFTMGSPGEILLYAALGLLLAPVAVAFIHVIHWQHDLWQRVRLPRPFKAALAGVLVGAVAIVFPQIMGPGREVMAEVLNGREPFTVGFLLALGLVKLLMTGVSLGGGFVGGIFAPTVYVGTMLGGAFGLLAANLLPDSLTGSPQAYAIAGMAAVMAGVVRAPITGILLVFELTNDYRLILPIMFTTVICVALTERLVPAGIDALTLLRAGLRLEQGRDVDVMQGVTVGEAMLSPAPTIPETASLVELRDALRQWRTRSLCVVDTDGLLTGIVTLTDLQRAYDSGGDKPLTVGDICSREVITAVPDDVLWTAIRTMGARDFGSLPVVQPGTRQPIGLLRRESIVRAYSMAVARKREQQHRAEQIRLNALTGAHVVERHIAPDALIAGQRIRDIDWPDESVVASIRRNGKLLVPHGITQLQAGDVLTIVVAREAENDLARLFLPADESP
ncbi:MAG: chloride channel protein [Chloroflexi bacterium]|nr:chloride channel protein [Chloroflexota bacterium]